MVNTYKHYDAGKALSSFDEHDGMIACFAARDGEKAMRIMEGHLARAAEIYK
jgi:DNA-binding GntR family transcriptional regulator